MGISEDFGDFFFNSISKNRVFSAKFINDFFTGRLDFKSVHFHSNISETDFSLIDFSRFADSILFLNSSLIGSSSTGCQSICSQNFQSSSVTSPDLRYLSNISFFNTSSLPASDQFIHENATILFFTDASSGTVIHAIYISPLARSLSNAISFFLMPCLNTSGQFTCGCLSNLAFNSSGIENVILTILSIFNTSCNILDTCNYMGIYKSFALNPITDVYFDYKSGKEIYFLDEYNNPVKVMSITQENYSGKIYDVDVPNDIVLVKRNRTALWSGNSNNGTWYGGGRSNGTAKYGAYSGNFDGDGDYVKVSDNPSLNFGSNNDFSISTWAKLDSSSDYRYIFVKANPAAEYQGYYMRFTQTTGDIKAGIDPGAGEYEIGSSTDYTGTGWHQFVMTVDRGSATGFKLYVDGSLDDTYAGTTNSDIDTTNPLYIGIGRDGSSWDFDGEIDELRIWNRSLSAAEIQILYMSNLKKYDSENWSLYINQSLNSTNILPDNTYAYEAYAKDTAGNLNQTETRTITIDTTNPKITIISPTATYHTASKIEFNISSNEQLDTCHYSIDNWVTNVSMVAVNTTYFNKTSTITDGTYTAKFFCNDTLNHINMTENVAFTVDTVAPNINFTKPTPGNATTQTQQHFKVNVSIKEPSLKEVIYNWNGTNYSIYNDSLVLMLNFDNVSSLGENSTHVVDLSGHCYDNKTQILTETGWKYFFDLEDEKVATLNQETMQLEYQLPYEKQVFNYNKEMYKIILEDGSDLLVSDKHRVYSSGEAKNSITSLVVNTSTFNCLLNNLSLDQIGSLSFNASPKKSISLRNSSVSSFVNLLVNDFASLKDDLYSSSAIKQTCNASSLLNLIKSSEEILALVCNSSECLFISRRENSGAKRSSFGINDLKADLFQKNVINTFVSTTNFIYIRPFFFNSASLSLLEARCNLTAQSVNSASALSFFNISSFQASCLALNSIDFLMNPDQFTSENFFISPLVSSGIDNVTDTIFNLPPFDVKKRNYVKVFKFIENNTQILTENGWKHFKELKDEKVATLNQETMQLEYHFPYEKQEFDYNKEMYKIILEDGIDLLVSDNHRVYLSRKYDNSLVSFIMVDEPIKDYSVSFNLKHQYKASNMCSFIQLEVTPKILEVFQKNNIAVYDLSNLLSDSNSKDFVFLSKLIELFMECGGNYKSESHLSPINLSSSSKDIGFILPDLSLSEVSSIDLIASLATSSLTSLVSSSEIPDMEKIDLLSSISLKSFNISTKARLAIADQLIKSLLSISDFNLSGTDNVIVPILDLQSNYLYYVYTKDIFKTFAFKENLSDFSLPLVSNVYAEFDKKLYKLILEDGSDLLVSDKHRVYSSIPNASRKSSVLKTLTEDWLLNPGSLDQIAAFRDNASANGGMSLSCINLSACDSNDLYFSGEKVDTYSLNSLIADSTCSVFNFEYFNKSDLLFLNSCRLYAAVDNSNPNDLEFTMINLTGLSLKNENKMLVSTTNRIYQPSALCLFQTRSLSLSPSFRQSSSVNSEFSSILSNFLSSSALLTFSDRNLRIASDRFNSGTWSICSLSSFGIDNVMFGILFEPPNLINSVYSVKAVHIYKSFALKPIMDVYLDINSGKEIYFLDKNNYPIKVKSITKENYSGKIYDVDVENDIVLVKRNGTALWSGNSNNGTWYGTGRSNGTAKYGAYSASFDGDSDYLNISDTDSMTFASSTSDNPFSIITWVYMNDATNFRIASKGIWTVNYEWNFGVAGDDLLYLSTYDESIEASYRGRYSSLDLSAYENQWISIIGTYDGSGTSSGFSLYLNAIRIDTDDYEANSYSAMENLGSSVSIGKYDSTYANGLIDEVRIYNRSLSAQEIQFLYMSNLKKYDKENWSLYVNQSKNSTTVLTDGTYTYQAYAKDEVNNLNQTEVRTITIDTTPPKITIISPTSTTYSTSRIEFNISANEQLDSCHYSIDNWDTNTSMVSYNNTYFNKSSTISDGTYTAKFFCNDTLNHINMTENVIFTIDATASNINFTQPTLGNNTIQTQQHFKVNVSIKESNLKEVIYNWNGTNYTFYNDSLVLMYNFDNLSSLGENSTHVVDLSKYTNNGTWKGGGRSNGTAKYGSYSGTFDGIDDYVNLSNIDMSGDISIVAWINPAGPSTGQKAIFSRRNQCSATVRGSAPATFGLGLDEASDDALSYAVIKTGTCDSGYNRDVYGTSDTIPDNKYSHVAVVVENNQQSTRTVRFYIDGVLADSSQVVNQDPVFTQSDSDSTSIGSQSDKPGYYSGYNGTIDELKIYNRSLSAGEIQIFYMSNLHKYDKENWSFYVNQSLNSTDVLPDNTYIYKAYAADMVGNLNQTEDRTLTIDTTPPKLTIISPTANFYTTSRIEFNISADEQLDTCHYSIDNWATNTSMVAVNTTYYNKSSTISDGTYTAKFFCNDTFNFINMTENVTFSVDATASNINFTQPTPGNNARQAKQYFEINVTIEEPSLATIVYEWNSTNYTIFNDSLVLMMNFDNLSALGENSTHIYDISGNGNNGTAYGNAFVNITGGKYQGGLQMDGDGDYVKVLDDPSIDAFSKFTMAFWINPKDTSTLIELVGKYVSGPYRGYDSYFNGIGSIDVAIDDSGCGGTVAITQDVWTHFAVTYNGSQMNLYYNGINGTRCAVAVGSIENAPTTLRIGRTWSEDSQYDYTGLIDEVFIWNRSLSASEIKQLYFTNLRKYDVDKWNLYINQSKNSTAVLTDGSYTYRAYATDTAGNLNSTETRTITIDTTPPQLTIISPTSTTYGTTRIEFNISASEQLSSCHYSIDNWVTNVSMVSVNTTYYNKSSTVADGTYTAQFFCNDTLNHINKTENVTFTIDATASNINFTQPTPSNNTIQTQQHYKVNVSIKESSLKEVIYNWNGTNYTMYNDSLVLMMNFDNVSALGEGTSDNITVDLSSYGNNGTIYNMTEVGGNYTTGKYGKALSFDGVDDFINLGTGLNDKFVVSKQFTVSAWVKTNGEKNVEIITNSKYAPPYTGMEFTMESDGDIRLDINQDADNLERVTADTAINDNLWHHVVAIHVDTTASNNKIYVDGIRQSITVNYDTGNSDAESTTNLQIGGRDGSNMIFNGTIDEVRIWNRSLTASEIQILYMSNLKKYDQENWSLYVNQSYNSSDILPDDTYTYHAYAKDTNNNLNSTETRTITIETPTDITNLYPNRTLGESLDPADLINISIKEPNNITFNITYTGSNVNINWSVNGSDQSSFRNKARFNWTGNYTQAGNYLIIVNVSNSVGHSEKSWILTVNESGCGDTLTVSSAILINSTSLQQTCYQYIYIQDGGTLTANVPLTITKNMIIYNGGTLTHTANNSDKTINITIKGNLTVEVGGKINVTGKGYGGGACGLGHTQDSQAGSGTGGGGGITQDDAYDGGGGAGYAGYGGKGGWDDNQYGDTAGAGGASYGSLTQPTDLGSGGGGGQGYSSCGAGGSGGGSVFLNITGTLNNSGIIAAKGINGIGTSTNEGGAGGGGSGGSIYILANEFTGNGSTTADGGKGGDATSTNDGAGGGASGGRIAVYYTTKTYTGTLTAYGGALGAESANGDGQTGAAGTIYLNHTSRPNFDLIINNGPNKADAVTPLGHNNYTIGNESIINNAKLNITGTLFINRTPLIINSSTLNITAGNLSTSAGNNLTLYDSKITAQDIIGPSVYNFTWSTVNLSTGNAIVWNTVYLSGSRISLTNLNVGAKIIITGSNLTIRGNLSLNLTNLTAENSAISAQDIVGPSLLNFTGSKITLSGNNTRTLSEIYLTNSTLNYSSGTNLYVNGRFDISGSSTLILSHLNVSVLTIPSGSLITHHSGNNTGLGLSITAVNLTIEPGGTINVTGRGYVGGACGLGHSQNSQSGSGTGGGGGITQDDAYDGGGGAGHAGYGGKGGWDDQYGDTSGSGGSSYGSLSKPTSLGSGGGGGQGYSSCGAGGSGGGSVFLNITDTLNNSGIIAAKGINGIGTSTNEGGAGGGGSGGSIYLLADEFTGNGSTTADGGKGGDATSTNDGAGGGASGGRIAVYYTTKTYTGSLTAYGGALGAESANGNGQTGAAGTIYLKQDSSSYCNLILDNNHILGMGTPLNSTLLNSLIGNLTIVDSANASFNEQSYLLNITDTINLTNARIHVTAAANRIHFIFNSSFTDTNTTYPPSFKLTYENASSGKIFFISAVTNIENLSTNIKIKNNSAFADTTEIPGLDQKANITFYHIGEMGFNTPVIYRDGVLNRDHYNFTSLEAETVIFNVIGFSNYSIGEISGCSVTLNLPINDNHSVLLSGNITFNCSAIDYDGTGGLRNITLYHNINGTWIANGTRNINGTSNLTIFYVNISRQIGLNKFRESEYKWNCLLYDSEGLATWGLSNFTFSGWNLGTYGNTTFNTLDNFIGLLPNSTGLYGNTTGNYTSKVFNAPYVATWTNISWDVGFNFYNRELPNYMEDETLTYTDGINMSGNVLLLHFNNDSAYENSTYVYDWSGNDHNGTAIQAFPNLTDKKLGAGSFQFDGSDDYVNLTVNDTSLGIADKITISVWVNPDAGETNGVVLGNQHFSLDTGFAFGIRNSYVGGLFSHGSYDSFSGTTSITTSLWHQLVLTYNGTHAKLYLDGVQEYSNSLTKWTANNLYLRIGREYLGIVDNINNPFNGRIDELSIWNRSLSADEILNIYKRGVLRLNLSARSCNDINCNGEAFSNFGGNATLTNISALKQNQYFQYKFNFQTDDANYTPELTTNSVTIGYTAFIEQVPNITSVYPNRTLGESYDPAQMINFSIAEPNNITFNITFTNNSVLLINWTVDGTEQISYRNKPEFNWTGNYTQQGSYIILANVSNSAGHSYKYWNMTVNNTPLPPVVTLNIPTNANHSVSTTDNITFNCSVTDLDGDLVNVTLYTSLNITANWSAIANASLTGSSNSTTFSINAAAMIGVNAFKDSTFTWNCIGYDSAGSSDWGDSNYTFSGWDLGSYGNTTLNISNHTIRLLKNSSGLYENKSGNYTSKVFNAAYIASWKNISWDAGFNFYNRELPDNMEDETLCVAENSLITMADSTKKKIIDIKPGEYVLSLDEKTGKLVSNRVKALLDMGTKPIYELTTNSGRSVNTTGNHPYLVKLYSEEECDYYAGDVWNGEYDEFKEYCTRWVRVSELDDGMEAAVPELKDGSETKKHDVCGGIGGNNLRPLFVDSVMVVKVFEDNDSFFESENQYKTSNADSLEFTQVMPQVLEMLNSSNVRVYNLLDLLSNSNCKGSVFSPELIENLFQTRKDIKRQTHFRPSSLSNFSKDILERGSFSLFFNFSMYSSPTSNSSIGSQPILSQNSWSSLEIVPVLMNSSKIFFLFNSSLFTSDQLTQEKCSMSAFNCSSTANVKLGIYITPLLTNCSNFFNCSTLFLSPDLATSTQFTWGSLSSFAFNSSGINNVILSILLPPSDYFNVSNSVDVFKPFDSEDALFEIDNDDNFKNKETKKDIKFEMPEKQSFSGHSQKSVIFDGIISIRQLEPQHVYDLEIENTHNFIANDIIAHNTYTNGVNMSGNVLLMHFNNNSDYENSTHVYDWSGNDNNGTWFGGGRSNGTAKLGDYSGWFDGSNKYISTSNSNALSFGSDNLAIGVWTKLGSTQTVDSLVMANWEEAGESWGANKWSLHNKHSAAGGSFYTFWVQNINAGAPILTSTTASNDNRWTYVNIVRDGNTFRLYRNGVQESSYTSSTAVDAGTTENIYVGGDISSMYLNGLIDELSIWNRTLSADEILNIYKRGVLRLNLSARTCNDPLCDTESFTNLGSNHTLTDTSSLTNNQYFQYKFNFQTDDANYTPELTTDSVTIGYEDSPTSITNLYPNRTLGESLDPANLINISITEPNNLTFNITYTGSGVTINWTVNRSEKTSFRNKARFNWTGNYTQAGDYLITVNVSNSVGHSEKSWILTVNDTFLNISINLTPNPVNINSIVTVSGRINLSNGTDIFNASVYIYLNGTLQNSNLGDGSDGILTVSSINTIVNNYTYLTGNESSGNITLTVSDSSEFSAGDELLIIQMQNYSAGMAGQYEYIRISSISGNDLTLISSVRNSYYSGAFNQINATVTQVVRVPQYKNVSVNSGASITAPAWDGWKGGIVVFRARETININGNINVSEKGFRGGIGGSSSIVNGYSGESYHGIGTMTRNVNYGGGGGGTFNTNGGGGGGYGTVGTVGGIHEFGGPGDGGVSYGKSNLINIYLGSGGGGGGYSNAAGGNGGLGGGIIMMHSLTIKNNGSINASGSRGSNGISNDAGGGGGSGGTIYLDARELNLTGKTQSLGGAGGISPNGYSSGGVGGIGRIRLDTDSITQTTEPVSGYNGTFIDYSTTTDSSGNYSYNFTSPLTSGNYNVTVNLTYNGLYGDKTQVLVVSQQIVITSVTTSIIPYFNSTLHLIASIADNNVASVNFTVTDPDGIVVIDNTNGTTSDNEFWNSTQFTLNKSRTYNYTIVATDMDGYQYTYNGTIDFAYVTVDLAPNPADINSIVVISGHINLSNSTYVVNASVYVYFNGTLQNSNFGDGNDGVLTISSINTIVNNYTYLTGNESSGNTTLTVNDSSEFSAGDELLIIQVQNYSGGMAGQYEYVRVSSVNGDDLALTAAIRNSYYSGAFNRSDATVTQIVKVPNYISVTINSDASITASAWDGWKGGIVVFRTRETIDINGNINVSEKGFRGGTGGLNSGVHGYSGESYHGIGTMTPNVNYGGGGGGEFNTNGGGGGGYGVAGTIGDGDFDGNDPGQGGMSYGKSNLTNIYLGSGGGGGGYSNNLGGKGGTGGGIIIIHSRTIKNNGSINASGSRGYDGISNGAGGGGGSGGTIYLDAGELNLTGKTQSLGGREGRSGYNPGGVGGVGRIRLDADSITGTTEPVPGYNGTFINYTTITNSTGYYSYNITSPSTAENYNVTVSLTYNGLYGTNTKVLTISFSQPNITKLYPNSSLGESYQSANLINISIAEPNNLTFNITYTGSNTQINWSVDGRNIPAYANKARFNWSGNYTQAGSYLILVNVTNSGGSSHQYWNLTVNNTNLPPITTLNLPIDNNHSVPLPENITFNCSATDTDALKNISLYTNINGIWSRTANKTLTGTDNSTTFTVDPSSLFGANRFIDSAFRWNCLVYDSSGQSSWASSNSTFSGWDLGTYGNTTLNISNNTISILKNSSGYYENKTGNYTSRIFNATYIADWKNISWDVPFYYYGMELASNLNNESGIGAVNMTDNVLLMHFNNDSIYENSTHIYDWSGNDNNGTAYEASPNLTDKKLGAGAFEFDGANDYIIINNVNFTGQANITISIWVKAHGGTDDYIIELPDTTDGSQGPGIHHNNGNISFQMITSSGSSL
ncbi:MAG: LamG-like jellyroll fold domain-containing protein, partial [Nanoarchaeota archaeon]